MGCPLALRRGKFFVQAFEEQGAVEKPGQGVVERELPQCPDRFLALGNVLDAALYEQAAGMVEWPQVDFPVPFASVGAPVAPFDDRGGPLDRGLDGCSGGNVGRRPVVLVWR